MNTTRDNINKAPEICFSYHPSDHRQVIAIKAGEIGYYPIQTTCTAEELNQSLFPKPTAQQLAAALVGSVFGWGCRGADPDTYTEEEARQLIRRPA